jgi:hypothetical protein
MPPSSQVLSLLSKAQWQQMRFKEPDCGLLTKVYFLEITFLPLWGGGTACGILNGNIIR